MTTAPAARRRRRLAILAALLAAHVVLLLELTNDRVTLGRSNGPDQPGTITLWLAPATKPRTAAATTPTPRPAVAKRRTSAPTPIVPVTPAPVDAITAPPAAPAAAPIDPRLTGDFSNERRSTTADAASPGPAASAPLRLNLDGFFASEREHEKHLSPAEEAMRDPRSNRLVLSPREKRMIAFGEVECIAWQREPDGTFYRGPGHWQRITPVPTGSRELRECVR